MNAPDAPEAECVTASRIVRLGIPNDWRLDTYYEGAQWLIRMLAETESALECGVPRSSILRAIRMLPLELEDEKTPRERPTRPPGE